MVSGELNVEEKTDSNQFKKISFSVNMSFFTKASRVYIVEHIAVLISLLLLVISGAQLFNILIDYLMSDRLDSINGYGVVSFEQLVGYLSLALVALPIFGLFYIRTGKAERLYPTVFESRARRRLGYFFMTAAVITLISYAVSLVYLTLSRILGIEETVAIDSWLQSALKIVFAMIVVAAAGLLVSKNIPGLNGEEQ